MGWLEEVGSPKGAAGAFAKPVLWWSIGNPLLSHLERQPASPALHLHAGEVQPGFHRAHLQDLRPAGGRGRADLPAPCHAGRGECWGDGGDSKGTCSGATLFCNILPCSSPCSMPAPSTPSAPTIVAPPPPPLSWDPTPSKSPSPSGRRSATAWMPPTPEETTGGFSPRSFPWTGGSPHALLSPPVPRAVGGFPLLPPCCRASCWVMSSHIGPYIRISMHSYTHL